MGRRWCEGGMRRRCEGGMGGCVAGVVGGGVRVGWGGGGGETVIVLCVRGRQLCKRSLLG